ncbi:ArsR family transcriptional regulator [Peribacillus saganii]|uniref:ArsR family transcriptional regulator n=1 Tax=Peribacillus saganii TaxID=2303992 RepID=A0A372LRL8_9BACI|nr:metalloregulator ArsR/SmtB family transcription factor [Peribacillus saganii]RFU70065.1 ArsR family transcriptional regulator [Peribacillus saganii]
MGSETPENASVLNRFQGYERSFKALADEKRLHILHLLCTKGSICVYDLTEIMGLTQSKLSYHLKILLDADLISKETKGTWSYYHINESEINQLLSLELCRFFKPARS